MTGYTVVWDEDVEGVYPRKSKMALTKVDLQDFGRFADERLDRDGTASLVELASEWEAQRREMEETVADIQQSHADIDAGRVESVADAFSDVRKQLGLG